MTPHAHINENKYIIGKRNVKKYTRKKQSFKTYFFLVSGTKGQMFGQKSE